MQRLRSSLLLGLALALLPTIASAQERSTIVGTVSVEGSKQPLSSAQVTVSGTTLRATSDVEGRFSIANVPRGTHSIRITRLGYRPVTKEVIVDAGPATLAVTMTSD